MQVFTTSLSIYTGAASSAEFEEVEWRPLQSLFNMWLILRAKI
jgi:hypothetical protein